MWTRTYLLLLAVRAYFALSPSYIHPDENFQGPEIIAGNIFSFPHQSTWEFTSEAPVRSVFPLWPAYGLPMVVLQWIWSGLGENEVSPQVIYYTLRAVLFIASFVLGDWAIHELVQSPKHRRLAVTLVASSYVTWTYQTHTFSNSIETLAVLWSLVIIQRILDNHNQRSSLLSPAILGLLLTFGTFNRITFPAFTLLPSLSLVPRFLRRPFSLLAFLSSGFGTTLVAIAVDTAFYQPSKPLFSVLFKNPTITPLNSLFYNSQSANLASHGLHPHYQHLIASLPLLLGPSLYLLLFSPKWKSSHLPLLSALSGTIFLSCIPHQEPRFLLPIVPLLLSSVHPPRSRTTTTYWLGSWIVFNTIFGFLMGIYHQGGVVPAQIWFGEHKTLTANLSEVLWWRTYSPPIWLLDHNPLNTTDLMGLPFPMLQMQMQSSFSVECNPEQSLALVAPYSSTALDDLTSGGDGGLQAEEMWRYNRHLNLDDLDFAEDGVWGTVKRVVGRRGLVIWRVRRQCTIDEGSMIMQGDW